MTSDTTLFLLLDGGRLPNWIAGLALLVFWGPQLLWSGLMLWALKKGVHSWQESMMPSVWPYIGLCLVPIIVMSIGGISTQALSLPVLWPTWAGLLVMLITHYLLLRRSH